MGELTSLINFQRQSLELFAGISGQDYVSPSGEILLFTSSAYPDGVQTVLPAENANPNPVPYWQHWQRCPWCGIRFRPDEETDGVCDQCGGSLDAEVT